MRVFVKKTTGITVHTKYCNKPRRQGTFVIPDTVRYNFVFFLFSLFSLPQLFLNYRLDTELEQILDITLSFVIQYSL